MSDEPDLARYGYRPEFSTLSICTACLGLFDDVSLGQGDGERQRCTCSASKEDRWPGYDYNERARLCDCCGRYVLRSGSRWSVWFCEECKARVQALNEEMGFALIPIGRHSMMNGLGLRVEARSHDVARFTQRLGDLFSRIDLLGKTWKPAHLRGQLKRLEFLGAGHGAVPLSVYLDAVAEEDRGSGVDLRLGAFGGLREVFGI